MYHSFLAHSPHTGIVQSLVALSNSIPTVITRLLIVLAPKVSMAWYFHQKLVLSRGPYLVF